MNEYSLGGACKNATAACQKRRVQQSRACVVIVQHMMRCMPACVCVCVCLQKLAPSFFRPQPRMYASQSALMLLREQSYASRQCAHRIRFALLPQSLSRTPQRRHAGRETARETDAERSAEGGSTERSRRLAQPRRPFSRTTIELVSGTLRTSAIRIFGSCTVSCHTEGTVHIWSPEAAFTASTVSASSLLSWPNSPKARRGCPWQAIRAYTGGE